MTSSIRIRCVLNRTCGLMEKISNRGKAIYRVAGNRGKAIYRVAEKKATDFGDRFEVFCDNNLGRICTVGSVLMTLHFAKRADEDGKSMVKSQTFFGLILYRGLKKEVGVEEANKFVCTYGWKDLQDVLKLTPPPDTRSSFMFRRRNNPTLTAIETIALVTRRYLNKRWEEIIESATTKKEIIESATTKKED